MRQKWMFLSWAVLLLAASSTLAGPKGKRQNPLVRVELLAGSTGIAHDGNPEYRDEGDGGADGVQSFLFPSGNFGLRLADSERSLRVDFGDDTPFPTEVISVSARELNNNHLVLEPGPETTCANAPGNGYLDGLRCITTGATRITSLYLQWDDGNTQYALDFSSFQTNPYIDPPTGADHVNVKRNAADEWVFYSDPGAMAALIVRSGKGKNATDEILGLFTMPVELKVTCAVPGCE